MTRLIGLLASSVALSAVAGPVHVPSAAQTATFTPSDAWPTIWLPEADAGLSDSSATVFVAADTATDQGIPLAFALDGGSVPLTFTLVAPPTAGWTRHTNMAMGWGMGLGAGPRNIVTTGAYRFMVYDGVGHLNDVTSAPPQLGQTTATEIEAGLAVIYAAYKDPLSPAGKVNAYHPILQDGGISYDTTWTGGSPQGLQYSFPAEVTALALLPPGNLLVAVSGGDAGALFTVDTYLKNTAVEQDGSQLGASMEGLAVYHASDAGNGASADWALVSTDGHLLLYQVKPTFAFVTELVIDSANTAPYYKGVAVSNLPLGSYDKGMVVVFTTNSSFVSAPGQLLFARWDDIVSAVDAGLAIDTSFDPRTDGPGRGGGGGGGGNGTPGLAQPPLGSGITSHNEFGGSCGGVPPPLTVVGALLALAGLARGRRRR